MKPLKKEQALKLAQKKFGVGAFVRDNGLTFHDGELRPVDEEDRAKLRAKHEAILKEKPTIAELKDWSRSTTIGEYLDALAIHNKKAKKWREAKDLAWTKVHSRERFEVGTVNNTSMFQYASVRGKGSTWEEALTDAGVELPKPKKKTNAARRHHRSRGPTAFRRRLR